MRTVKQSLLAGVGAVLSLAIAGQAAAGGTTRIETRPFYGAVVTIEEGVRVFRPLPNTERVIINPGGATPLSLGFNETYVNERRYNYNYNSSADDGDSRRVYGVGGGFYGYGHRGHHGGRGNHGYGGGMPGRGVR